MRAARDLWGGSGLRSRTISERAAKSAVAQSEGADGNACGAAVSEAACTTWAL